MFKPEESGMYFTPDLGDTWVPISKSDLKFNKGLARDIPLAWGGGYFRKVVAGLQPEAVDHAAESEELQKYRELAKANPREYLPDVAKALTALGNSYVSTQRAGEAIEAFTEALQTYRGLAKTNPGKYLPDVALTLNSLGLMYSRTQRQKEAVEAYNESLQIDLELPKITFLEYLPRTVSATLINLDDLDGGTQRRKEIAWADKETLKDFRALAEANPHTYLPYVALTLKNLAVLYIGRTRQLKDAADAYAETLQIYRDLAKMDPKYLPDVAAALNTLGLFYRSEGRSADAAPFCAEAKAMFIDLAADHPAKYRPAVESVCVGSLF